MDEQRSCELCHSSLCDKAGPEDKWCCGCIRSNFAETAMTTEELLKLKHGLYRVFWKEGGSSLAAVGSGPDGRRWLAATNWINIASRFDWSLVHHVEPIVG
jgi:hypothetical protein